MAYKVKLQCPGCNEKFYCAGDWPDCCPLCGYDTALSDDNVITMPALRKAATGATDKVYRDMERASEHRVHAAAEMAGVPASDMAALKMTDLKDNTREGENAVAEKVPDIGQKWLSNGAEYGSGIASGAVTINGKTVTGIAPRAGAATIQGIQRLNGRG